MYEMHSMPTSQLTLTTPNEFIRRLYNTINSQCAATGCKLHGFAYKVDKNINKFQFLQHLKH